MSSLPSAATAAGVRDHLPLAVVAEPARLEHGGQTRDGESGIQVARRVDSVERRGRDVQLREHALLREPVLGGGERRRCRQHR